MPQVSVQPANLGGGSSVYVHAVDERQSDVLGNRAAGAVGAKISVSSAEIVAVVDQSLVTGLRDLGFAPSPQPVKGVPELRVEIRVLEYKVSMGFWAGSLDIDAAMKAICIRGNDRGHEQLHRGHYEDAVLVVQSASNNDEYINKALSGAINEILHDRPLMECLARPDGARAGTP
jgi:hypothetical protein